MMFGRVMLKSLGVLATAVLFLMPESVLALDELTLQDAERIAIESNLGLQANSLRQQAAQNSVSEQRGRLYDPRLRLTTAAGESRDILNLTTTSINEASYLRLDASLMRTLSSGGEIGLSLSNQWQDSRSATISGVDPQWRSELRLSLTQPLLKGFGAKATEEPIEVAIKGDEAAAAGVQAEMATLLARVRNAFSDIHRARRFVSLRESSLALATTILAENRARVAVGVLPPIDVLEAEVGVSQREKDLLDARQGVDDLLDRLAEQLGVAPPIRVVSEPLPPLDFSPDEEADLSVAYEQRPELQRAAREQERSLIEAAAAEDRKKPSLDLSAFYAQRGLGGDYGDDLDQTLTDVARNWEVGVTFNYPLGNRQAEFEALRKQNLAEAARRDVLQQREQVRREVRAAIRQLQVGQLRFAVTKKGLELAEEKLKNLLKRREVGLATTRDVLEGETELAQAQADHTDAQATLEQAGTEYLRSTGRLISHEGFTVATVRP